MPTFDASKLSPEMEVAVNNEWPTLGPIFRRCRKNVDPRLNLWVL